jgi:iron complex outermembrane receptor protein
VVSSTDVNATSAQLLMTYFNVDDELDLYGTDVALTALLSPTWSMEVSGSLVSDDVFTTRLGTRVTLNAPKRKASLAGIYRNDRLGLHGEGRVRYTAEYPVDSGVYRAIACLGDTGEGIEPCVGEFALFDLTLGYRLPQVPGAAIQLTVQNLFDEDYRSFPGVPDVGRMALLRLHYGFGGD